MHRLIGEQILLIHYSSFGNKPIILRAKVIAVNEEGGASPRLSKWPNSLMSETSLVFAWCILININILVVLLFAVKFFMTWTRYQMILKTDLL